MAQEPIDPPPSAPVTGPTAEGDADTYKKVFNEELVSIDALVTQHGRDAAILMIVERMNKLRELSFVTKIRMNCDYMRIDQLKKEVTAETRAKVEAEDRRYQPVKRSTAEGDKRPKAEPKSTEQKAVETLMKRLNVSEDQARAMLKMQAAAAEKKDDGQS